MQPDWVDIGLKFLSAGGAIGFISLIVKWFDGKKEAKATQVDQAIKGLVALTERQDAVIERQDTEIAELKAELAAEKKRKGTA